MIHIFKVKWRGRPIRTFTSTSLKKEQPSIYSSCAGMRPGDTRRIGKNVAAHFLHPREMSIKARRKVCGPGLRGEARRKFIEEGMTYQEQAEVGKLLAVAETNAAVQRWRDEHPEEYATRIKHRKARAEAKRKEEGRIDYSKYYSPDKIAKAAGLTAPEVRKFLRKKNIGKRGGRYAFTKKEATRIARAAKRYYQQKG